MTWLGQPTSQYEKLSGGDEESQEPQESKLPIPLDRPANSLLSVLRSLYFVLLHLVLILLIAKLFIWPLFHPQQGSSNAVDTSYTYCKPPNFPSFLSHILVFNLSRLISKQLRLNPSFGPKSAKCAASSSTSLSSKEIQTPNSMLRGKESRRIPI